MIFETGSTCDTNRTWTLSSVHSDQFDSECHIYRLFVGAGGDEVLTRFRYNKCCLIHMQSQTTTDGATSTTQDYHYLLMGDHVVSIVFLEAETVQSVARTT
jgi:hypothetical protein